AVRVLLLIHHSTLSFRPPASGRRKSGPLSGHPVLDMGWDGAGARPDQRYGLSINPTNAKRQARRPAAQISMRTALSPVGLARAAGGREFGDVDVGLVFGGGIGAGLRAAPVLQEGDAAQAGLGLLFAAATAVALLAALAIVAAALALLAALTMVGVA